MVPEPVEGTGPFFGGFDRLIHLSNKSLTQTPIPRPNHVPILHDYPAFQRNPLAFWLETGLMAPVVQVRLGPARRYWVITDAELFQYVFQTRAKNFPRDRQLRNRKGLDPAATSFNAPTWDEWLWRRRLLQPAFHGRELGKFGEEMVTEAAQLIEETPTTASLNLNAWMKTLTMRIITRTMFSASLNETDRLQRSFEQTTAFNYKRMSSVANLPLWLPTPNVQQTKRAIATRREIISAIVNKRLASGKAKGDLLDMLISAHLDEDGRKFTGNDLISEMNSIIFAGHETTAMTLVWIMVCLSRDPSLEEAVRSEIEAVLGDRSPRLADFDAMPLTHNVILETLRLYPSVYLTLREAEDDDVLGDLPIPAGTQLIMNIRGLHRDSRYWEKPEELWPERHTPVHSAGRHKFAFMPFIAGPKKCIGDAFAMMEMRLVVPAILQKWRFSTQSPHPIKEKAGFVLDTEEAVRMRVEKV